jgi:hypothetical protein
MAAEDGSEQITSRAASIDDGLELRKGIGSGDSSSLRGRESGIMVSLNIDGSAGWP